ncbi:hypothetical protein R3P38DRAFT_3210676 [Favolaschia claudopus]|uniref:Uncharacterized protein n=1 Tax=Favolaschia claudopus TaxID=2862362 RepID=A0AAW0AH11_9AGAR
MLGLSYLLPKSTFPPPPTPSTFPPHPTPVRLFISPSDTRRARCASLPLPTLRHAESPALHSSSLYPSFAVRLLHYARLPTFAISPHRPSPPMKRRAHPPRRRAAHPRTQYRLHQLASRLAIPQRSSNRRGIIERRLRFFRAHSPPSSTCPGQSTPDVWDTSRLENDTKGQWRNPKDDHTYPSTVFFTTHPTLDLRYPTPRTFASYDTTSTPSPPTRRRNPARRPSPLPNSAQYPRPLALVT